MIIDDRNLSRAKEDTSLAAPIPEELISAGWYKYGRNERHASWKLLLPVSEKEPVLAVGLKGRDLASLGRSWSLVHAYKCSDREIEWAIKQAQCLGDKGQLKVKVVTSLDRLAEGYSAIAVDSESGVSCAPDVVFRLLEPGGTALWVGRHRDVPSRSSLDRQGYDRVRSYAMMPPGDQTAAIPISQRESTFAALELFMPGTLRGRLLLRIGCLLAIAGYQKILGVKRIIAGSKQGTLKSSEYLQDWISNCMVGSVADFAIYTGWERLVVQLLDDNKRVLGIMKISETRRGSVANEHEARVLQQLHNIPDLRSMVPQIMMIGTWQGKSVQVQSGSNIGRRRYTVRLTPMHIRFLQGLSYLGRSEMYLEEWPRWRDIQQWAHNGRFASTAEAKQLRTALKHCYSSLKGFKIPFHRVHGDFNPWNVLVGPEQIMVVDWEESQADGLPLSDLVRFGVARQIAHTGKRLSVQHFLSPEGLLEPISSELEALRKSLSLPAEIVQLAAIHECWVRFSWWMGGNMQSAGREQN